MRSTPDEVNHERRRRSGAAGHEAIAGRRVHRIEEVADVPRGRLGQLPQTASVGLYGPDVVVVLAVGIERDLLAVRRPRRAAIPERIVGEASEAGAVSDA